MNKNKNLFCILGPTAIGKSYISMKLCDLLPLEIISVDSTLIYKYLNIGTAKPTKNDLLKYPHRLVNIINPNEYYSVNIFFNDILKEIYDIFYIKNNIPLLVGGSMMYYNVLFNGLYNLPKSNFCIRKYINLLFDQYGCKYLYNLLCKIDNNLFNKIHYNDKYRITRNLEIFLTTKKNISYFKNKNKLYLDYKIHKIIILPMNKDILINNIKKRFLNMLDMGFEKEVLYLYNRGDLNIKMPFMKCIGYKQMWLYLEKKISYFQMKNSIINNTLLLLKKQLSWLKRWSNNYIIKLDNYNNCIKKIFNYINKHINDK